MNKNVGAECEKREKWGFGFVVSRCDLLCLGVMTWETYSVK